MQSAYLADPDVTGFFGVKGLDALGGPLYWATQPLILGLILGAARIGAMVRGRALSLLREMRPA